MMQARGGQMPAHFRFGLLPAVLAAWLATLAPSTALGEGDGPSSLVAGHIVNVAGKVRIRKEGTKDSKDIRIARAGDVVMVGDIINTPSDGMIKLLMKDKSLMDLGPSSLFKVNRFTANSGADRQVEATIVYGSLRAAVTQKLQGRGSFKVRSPSATMGVRGTEFVIKSDMPDPRALGRFLNGRSAYASAGSAQGIDLPLKSEITVLQGKVEVAMPQAPQLPPGGAPAGAAGAPPVSPSGSGTLMLAAGAQLVSQVGGASPPAPQARVLDSGQLTQVASVSRVTDNTFSGAVEIKGATKDEERREMSERRESRQQAAAPEAAAAAPESRPQSQGQPKEEPKKEAVADAAGAGARPAEGPAPEARPQSGSSSQEVASREASPSDRGPASTGGAGPGRSARPPASANLAMNSFVQTTITSVQLGSSMTQTIRPADFVPAVPLSATGIQARALPNPNQLHMLTVRVKLTP